MEVDCGAGREVLRLGVVMAGEDVRELGLRIGAGVTVKITGVLRAGRGRSLASGVEVLASEISEIPANPDP